MVPTGEGGATQGARDAVGHELPPELPPGLPKELLLAYERERAGLAEGVDDAIQRLAAALLHLDRAAALATREGGPPDPDSVDGIREARTILEDVVREARGMMGQLRPPVLEQRGLVAAIKEETEVFLPPTEVEVLADLGPERLPATEESIAFRALQEAIRSARDAQGVARLEVGLMRWYGSLVGWVQSEGGTSDPRTNSALSAALVRVRMAGGSVRVQRGPCAGASVRFTLPLDGELSEEPP